MALPRFQIGATRPRRSDEHGGPSPQYTWRFLTANNRTLARSALTYSNLPACLAAIRAFQAAAGRAVAETGSDGRGQWTWRGPRR